MDDNRLAYTNRLDTDFAALEQSDLRKRFHLDAKDAEYFVQKGLGAVLEPLCRWSSARLIDRAAQESR